MSKKVIITGVTGQDGSYMIDYLLANTEHKIIGVERRVSNPNRGHLLHVNNPRVKFVQADVTDANSMDNLIREEAPDYFINFAANSFVGNSWDMPCNHMETNFIAVINQLEAIRKHAPQCRYYQAGSSEQFGDVEYFPQDEDHPFRPRSPYAVAKCAAHHAVKVWRESYKLYAVQGILFNHESPRRGSEFVTQKIVENAVRIRHSLDRGEPFAPLKLGNLDAKRDWSHAEDFVDGIWRMLNQETYNPVFRGWCCPHVSPYAEQYWSQNIKEYVLASGEAYTVRDFVNKVFELVGIKGHWQGKKENEKFIADIWDCGARHEEIAVEISPEFYRPAEVNLLLGNPDKAKAELGWNPKHTLTTLARDMVNAKLNI